jgi:hypothetical protein
VRAEWKSSFPEDVATEVAFYAWRKEQCKADSVARRADKARFGAFTKAYISSLQMIDDNHDRWLDQFSSSPLDSSREDDSDFDFQISSY